MVTINEKIIVFFMSVVLDYAKVKKTTETDSDTCHTYAGFNQKRMEINSA